MFSPFFISTMLTSYIQKLKLCQSETNNLPILNTFQNKYNSMIKYTLHTPLFMDLLELLAEAS